MKLKLQILQNIEEQKENGTYHNIPISRMLEAVSLFAAQYLWISEKSYLENTYSNIKIDVCFYIIYDNYNYICYLYINIRKLY